MHDDEPVIPHPPYDDLRAGAAGDPAVAAQVDALEAHVRSTEPDPRRLEEHVDGLRGVRDLEARIANWWDDPATQRWIKGLGDAGL